MALLFSRTSRREHFQNGNAIIDEVNKVANRDLTSSDQLLRSLRNVGNMNRTRSSVFNGVSFNGQKDSKSKKSDTEGSNMDSRG